MNRKTVDYLLILLMLLFLTVAFWGHVDRSEWNILHGDKPPIPE